ncbi:MAG TPA: tetratricopeptide repeat protein [Thermoleophilaceae bacterium]|nr:tetratricopeptide repeat protein [Thermoleophilaceae bacterium]
MPFAALALVLVAAAIGVAALSGGGDDGRETTSERAGNGAAANGARSDRKGSGKADRKIAQGGESPPKARPAPQPEPEPEQEPEAQSEPVTGDPAALNERGYELMQAGDYEGAIPLLEQAVAAYPEGSQDLTYAYALYNLGRSLRLAGRADEAVPILERRLQIPNQTETVQQELDAARAAS